MHQEIFYYWRLMFSFEMIDSLLFCLLIYMSLVIIIKKNYSSFYSLFYQNLFQVQPRSSHKYLTLKFNINVKIAEATISKYVIHYHLFTSIFIFVFHIFQIMFIGFWLKITLLNYVYLSFEMNVAIRRVI